LLLQNAEVGFAISLAPAFGIFPRKFFFYFFLSKIFSMKVSANMHCWVGLCHAAETAFCSCTILLTFSAAIKSNEKYIL
jgi:hypothetical protein